MQVTTCDTQARCDSDIRHRNLNTNPTPIEVDLRLKSGEVSIAEIARLAAAFGIAFAPDTTVTGKVDTDVRHGAHRQAGT